MQRFNNCSIARVDGKIFCEVCGDHVEISKYRMHARYAHKEIKTKVKKEFKCELCQKQFTSNYNLQYHLAHHYNLKNFVCDQCPNAYNTQADLSQHKRTHDKGKLNYRCDECGEFFDIQSRYKTHMKTHGKKIGVLECKVCQKVLSSAWHLSEHMTVHSTERKLLKCEHCNKEFVKKESLKRHTDVVHLGLKKYLCIICGKAFGNPNDRRKHELIHQQGRNGTYCTYCKKYFDDIKLHDETAHKDFLFTCDVCHRKFLTEREIRRHKLMKHQNEAYICDLCGHGYGDLYHLRCHIQNHIAEDIKNSQETPSRVLDCSICGKHFNYPRSVIRHILSVHEKVKDFECEYCDKRFSDKGDLNKHMKRFHEDRNFGKFCKICKVTVEDVKEHFDQLHDDLQFICDICHVRFNTASSLTYHKKQKHESKTNAKFKCSTCDKRFAFKSLLTKHEAIHRVKKPPKIMKNDKTVENEYIEIKQEPMDHVEAIISYPMLMIAHDDYGGESRDVKQEPIESIQEPIESIQETAEVFFVSNIKHEESENEEMYHEENTKSSTSDYEVDNLDDEDWSINYTSSSDEETKSDIKIKEEEIKSPPRKKRKVNDEYPFKLLVEKYPLEKDGKKLQVRCRLCFEVFKSVLEYRDHFLENHFEKDNEEHCKVCNITFDSHKSRLEHFKLVHEKFNCDMCKLEFLSLRELREHNKENHDDKDSKLMCSFCGKTYCSQISLNFHIDSRHKEIRFPCDMCDKSYSFKSALYRHRLIFHLKGRTQKCPQCNFMAGTKNEIKLHIDHHHNLNRKSTRSDIVCVQCGMQFHNESTRKRHNYYMHGGMLMRHRNKCPFCEEPLLRSDKAGRHVTQVHLLGKKPLRQCGYCKVEIKLYEEYKQHIESHPGVYICITCGDPHYTVEDLKVHERIHSRIQMHLRKFQCDFCPHRTFSKAQMIVHLTKHTTAPELHTCEICGKGFKIASSLYTHRLYHNEGTIPCKVCKKKFVRNVDLKYHVQKEHTIEKPFKCPVCSHGFHLQQALNSHLQTHPQTMKIYKCELCNVAFGNKKKDLDHHNEINHPEKRPYRCFICNSTFTHQFNLDRHNTKHLKASVL